MFGSTAEGISKVSAAVRSVCKNTLIVKLSPNVTDITEMAKAAEDSGADSVSLINTLLGMAIDINTKKPILGNVMGGLSGPAVNTVAVRMVYQVSKTVKIHVIGMGGISGAEDAVEFLLAGASAVMIGTAGFVNPYVWVETVEGLKRYMERHGFEKVTELTGALLD